MSHCRSLALAVAVGPALLSAFAGPFGGGGAAGRERACIPGCCEVPPLDWSGRYRPKRDDLTCPELFWVEGVAREGSEHALLTRYAPIILQFVADADVGGKERDAVKIRDYVTGIDFDGDDNAADNWPDVTEEAAHWFNVTDERFPTPPAVVYSDVVAVTTNQVYLLYYLFHAVDYSDGRFLDELGRWVGHPPHHENDLEGGMVVVDRESGAVVHVYALYHNKFSERHLGGGAEPDRGPRQVVWVEAGGHGSHLIACNELARLEDNRTRLVVYMNADCPHVDPRKCTTSDETTPLEEVRRIGEELREDGSGPKCVYLLEEKLESTDAVSWYDLVSMRRLFVDMFADRSESEDCEDRPGSPCVYDDCASPGAMTFHAYRAHSEVPVFRALRGRVGQRNAAKFPWGQGSDYHRFFDPVSMVLAKEDRGRHLRARSHQPISTTYLYNPYLQAALMGKTAPLLNNPANPCPRFYEAHNRPRARRENLREYDRARRKWVYRGSRVSDPTIEDVTIALRDALDEYAGQERGTCRGFPDTLQELLARRDRDRICDFGGPLREAARRWRRHHEVECAVLADLHARLSDGRRSFCWRGHEFRYEPRTPTACGATGFSSYRLIVRPQPWGMRGHTAYKVERSGPLNLDDAAPLVRLHTEESVADWASGGVCPDPISTAAGSP